MEKKEIRFIDSHYKELFRIPDGGRIKITTKDGAVTERKCKYIGSHHTQIGYDVFHICQFAELMEKAGNTYEPTAETLKAMDLAFVEQNYDKLNRDKFFKTDNGFIEEYYNPDATAGGQLVCVEISDDIIKDAAKIKDKDLFFSHIEAYGKQVLFDAGTPEFRDMLKSFMENKADFEGESRKSMYGLMKAVGIKPPNRDMER